jgi:hypothetical protein
MESLVKKLAEYPSNAAFLEKVGGYLRRPDRVARDADDD